MKASLLKIENILGIEQIEIKLGSVTLAEGGNGAGKTSIVESLRSLFDGGSHEATLLRNGAEKGEIVLVLDDGSTLRKVVKPGRSSFSFTDSEGRDVPSPVARLRSLVDTFAANPIAFLQADKKERAKVLLEALKPEIDREELELVAGSLPAGLVGFDLLAAAEKKVFDERTAENRIAKEAAAAAKQFRAGISGENPELLKAERESAKVELSALHSRREEAAFAATAAEKKEISDLEALQVEDRKELQVLRDRIREIEARVAGRSKDIDVAKGREAAAAKNSYQETAAAVSELEGRIRLLDSKIEAASREAGLREAAEKSEQKSRDAEEKSRTLSGDLETIAEFRKRALANLPIPGLEVRDGEVYFEGVIFDRLNTAKRVEIAIEVAKIRAGELALVSIDGLEAFDAETFEEFERAAEASGVQFFGTKVGEGKLRVSSK